MAKQTKNVSSGGESFMVKLSTFIVDKRNLFFLITIILVIFSMFSRNWVEVENDLTFYLPEDSETKKALNVMDGEFTTYGTAEVMVANIAYEDAKRMLDDLKQIKGVQSIDFDDTTDHYNNASALYSITFNYDETDDACLESLDKVKEYLSGQDIYVKTDLGNTQAETIEREIKASFEKNPSIIIQKAIRTANKEIRQRASEDPNLYGMGTTVVVATVIGRYLQVANVGDSRLYIANGQEIRQITRDHSLVEEMVRLGGIKREEARLHPDKNIITRAIGAKDDVDIDFFTVELRPSDRILMCSDGLTNMVEDQDILKVLNEHQDDKTLVETARALIDTANQNGGKDNIAVVLIKPFADEVKK